MHQKSRSTPGVMHWRNRGWRGEPWPPILKKKKVLYPENLFSSYDL